MKKYPIIGTKYKHYKGGTYKVLSLATHTENDEVLVIYKSIHFGTVFARPLSLWFDEITTESGDNTLRFVPL